MHLPVFLTIVILWTIFGKIDLVAEVEGTIIPGGKVKTIQASQLPMVRKIHVDEGSREQLGDPLITLAATNAAVGPDRAHGRPEETI